MFPAIQLHHHTSIRQHKNLSEYTQELWRHYVCRAQKEFQFHRHKFYLFQLQEKQVLLHNVALPPRGYSLDNGEMDKESQTKKTTATHLQYANEESKHTTLRHIKQLK